MRDFSIEDIFVSSGTSVIDMSGFVARELLNLLFTLSDTFRLKPRPCLSITS